MTPKRIVIILLGLILIAILCCAWWQGGGSEPSLSYVDFRTGKPNPDVARVFYRGMQIPGTPLVLFKRYYAITEKDPSTGFTTLVAYTQPGYNPFFYSYPDGKVAAAGECMVKPNPDQILHDINDVKTGVYFDPKGDFVSTVEDGTGLQTFFYPDGVKSFELRVDNFRRTSLTIWNPDGSVKSHKDYTSPQPTEQ